MNNEQNKQGEGLGLFVALLLVAVGLVGLGFLLDSDTSEDDIRARLRYEIEHDNGQKVEVAIAEELKRGEYYKLGAKCQDMGGKTTTSWGDVVCRVEVEENERTVTTVWKTNEAKTEWIKDIVHYK